jgi:hypothetical protein
METENIVDVYTLDVHHYRGKKETHCCKLDVIAVISNPCRYDTRYRLFNEFCCRMKRNPTVRLTTVELQQRSRPFVTDATIKLRSSHEVWYKENLINIAVQNLPDDWEYVAWVDADLEFQNKNWARDTIEQLQAYDIVQLFSHALDLGPNGETLTVHTGFNYLYVNGEQMSNYTPGSPYKNGHTGYAWACRRSAYDAIGGLMEFCILGSADAHMAMAFIGKVEKTLNKQLHENYKELCRIFEDRCESHIKRNIGYVQGTINHNWHSCKSLRFYQDRWMILTANQFDPLRDIKKDAKNLWVLESNKPKLRDDIRLYFRSRHEDSIDLHQDYSFTKKKYV